MPFISISNPKVRHRVFTAIDLLTIVLSVALIVYISVDTFSGVKFLDDHHYMVFQFWVCMAFIAFFFIELWLSDDRRHYCRSRWFYVILSIPWLNIINYCHIDVPADLTYFLRFIPLARGALAVTIVVGYLSRYRGTNMFASYLVILISIIYFGSLIFMEREQGVNPQVADYGSALWWACMDATTAGSSIEPVTVAGKVTGCIISVMGTIMFPLFTVYATDTVRRYYADRKQRHASALE